MAGRRTADAGLISASDADGRTRPAPGGRRHSQNSATSVRGAAAAPEGGRPRQRWTACGGSAGRGGQTQGGRGEGGASPGFYCSSRNAASPSPTAAAASESATTLAAGGAACGMASFVPASAEEERELAVLEDGVEADELLGPVGRPSLSSFLLSSNQSSKVYWCMSRA